MKCGHGREPRRLVGPEMKKGCRVGRFDGRWRAAAQAGTRTTTLGGRAYAAATRSGGPWW